VVRRLGPRGGRIELAKLPNQNDERHLLRLWDTDRQSAHWASDKRSTIRRDLESGKQDWLLNAAHAMTRATEEAQKVFSTFLMAGEHQSAPQQRG
jgi:hypothetical protein